MLEWIKQNKKLTVVIAAILAAGIALASGAITWEQFISLFERAQESVPAEIEGG